MVCFVASEKRGSISFFAAWVALRGLLRILLAMGRA